MYVTCSTCGMFIDDEFRSTVCPHKGIGFCAVCDCVFCVCGPSVKNPASNSYDPIPDSGTLKEQP